VPLTRNLDDCACHVTVEIHTNDDGSDVFPRERPFTTGGMRTAYEREKEEEEEYEAGHSCGYDRRLNKICLEPIYRESWNRRNLLDHTPF
jgi:hypothetical protein